MRSLLRVSVGLLVCGGTALAAFGQLESTLRLRTYELEWVRERADIQKVDHVFSRCAMIDGYQLVFGDADDDLEALAKAEVREYLHLVIPAIEPASMTQGVLPATTAGAQRAVQAIQSPTAEETAEFRAARADITAALVRSVTRKPWLHLYEGAGFDANHLKTYGYFAVIDERNREVLLVGDGPCPRAPEP